MTSKISFYSLRRENMKHRIGMILTVGFLFFAYLIFFLISVQNIFGRYDKRPDIISRITALSEPEMSVGTIAVFSAVLLAVSGFRYLHSKKEVDFYHSLPVKRRTHLYIIMTNDLLVFTAFLILLLCFQCVIAAVAGAFSPVFGINMVWSFFCYLVVFAASYVTMALAMILTGQTFVGLLGFGVIVMYVPLILHNLYPYLASVFYKTYCVNTEWGKILTYISPLSLTGKLLIDYSVWTWKAHITAFVLICVWIFVTAAAVFILFDKRPSEMAGKAMAFPKMNGVLRILLVIPVSIYVGLYLYSASFSSVRGWIIAGVIIGGFLSHGVIECIYRFDIRGLLACKRQMIFSVAAALFIVGLFWADVSGYDAYLPAKEETDAVLIDNGYGSVYNESYWGRERKGVSGEVKDEVLDILADVVKENDKNHEAYYGDRAAGGYSFYVIRYRLKNGREKQRSYVLDLGLKDRLKRQLFTAREYREDQYFLYTGDWSRVRDVEFYHFMESTVLKMTEKQREELFRIYLEEFDGLDYDTAKGTIPVGRLVVDCVADEEDDTGNSYVAVICRDIGESYYIYPSFKNTIGYLEKLLKEKLPLSFEEVAVTRLDIWQYNNEGPAEEYTIKDEKFIRSVKGKFVGSDSGENLYPVDTSLDIRVTFRSANGSEQVTVHTDAETVEKIKEYHKSEN